MDVTREDVLRCARLAHLRLAEEEIEPMRQAMAQVLTHAASLDELDLWISRLNARGAAIRVHPDATR